MMCFLALVLPSETLASRLPIMGGTIYLAMSFLSLTSGFLLFLSSQVSHVMHNLQCSINPLAHQAGDLERDLIFSLITVSIAILTVAYISKHCERSGDKYNSLHKPNGERAV